MPNQKQVDPYVYPGTNTLINKFDIKDPDKLQEMEGLFFLSKKSDPLPNGQFDYEHLKALHRHYFGDVYEWAGQERTVDIAKGNSYFGNKQYLTKELNKLFVKLKEDNYLRNLTQDDFCKKLSLYFNEINAAHPFREGNGRTQRAFCDALAEQAGFVLDWTKANKEEYLEASIAGFLHADYIPMENVLRSISVPLQRSQVITEINVEKNTIDLLKQYINKQIELTECVKQKNQLLLEKSSSKIMSQKVLVLNNEAKQLAKKINSDSSIKKIFTQSQLISLKDQGGFIKINERFQNNTFTEQDIFSVLNHAKNYLSASQNVNQKNIRSQ